MDIFSKKWNHSILLRADQSIVELFANKSGALREVVREERQQRSET